MKTKTIYNKISLSFITILFILINFNYTLASPINSQTLINLTNKSRMEYGDNPLKVNAKLTQAAESKAKDMLTNDYFEHYSPLGKSPWSFIKSAGYDYVMAGENLAMDFKTSEGIHNAWMASESHKDNIIKKDYEEIGIVAVSGDFNGHETTMVVQMFGTSIKQTNILNNLMWKISNWILGL